MDEVLWPGGTDKLHCLSIILIWDSRDANATQERQICQAHIIAYADISLHSTNRSMIIHNNTINRLIECCVKPSLGPFLH